MNSEQLFQINKKINQIKRNLQSRQQKAIEWSGDYKKILYKNKKIQYLDKKTNNSQNRQLNKIIDQNELKQIKIGEFENNKLRQDNCNLLTQTTRLQGLKGSQHINKRIKNDKLCHFDLKQRQQIMEVRVKKSRKKIKEYYNELKQLDLLEQRKTKLYLKKLIQKNQLLREANSVQNKNIKQNKFLAKNEDLFYKNNKNNTICSSLSVNLSKKFGSSLFTNTSNNLKQYNQTSFIGNRNLQLNIRTNKDRINPFQGFKADNILEIFQQAKSKGKQHLIAQIIGIGLNFTPFSLIKKTIKKEQTNHNKQFSIQTQSQQIKASQLITQNSQTYQNSKKQKIKNKYLFKRDLSKNLSCKINQQKNIYLNQNKLRSSQSYQQNINHNLIRSCSKKQHLTLFQKRLKKVMAQSDQINLKYKKQNCISNQLQKIKQKNKIKKNKNKQLKIITNQIQKNKQNSIYEFEQEKVIKMIKSQLINNIEEIQKRNKKNERIFTCRNQNKY